MQRLSTAKTHVPSPPSFLDAPPNQARHCAVVDHPSNTVEACVGDSMVAGLTSVLYRSIAI